MTIASQNETQSAHWSHGQATLFTAHAWIKDGSESFVLVSDDLNHTKYSVYVYISSNILSRKSPQLKLSMSLLMVQVLNLNGGICFQTCTIGRMTMVSRSHGTFLLLLMERVWWMS